MWGRTQLLLLNLWTFCLYLPFHRFFIMQKYFIHLIYNCLSCVFNFYEKFANRIMCILNKTEAIHLIVSANVSFLNLNMPKKTIYFIKCRNFVRCVSLYQRWNDFFNLIFRKCRNKLFVWPSLSVQFLRPVKICVHFHCIKALLCEYKLCFHDCGDPLKFMYMCYIVVICAMVRAPDPEMCDNDQCRD
jgi:hypothetical protein